MIRRPSRLPPARCFYQLLQRQNHDESFVFPSSCHLPWQQQQKQRKRRSSSNRRSLATSSFGSGRSRRRTLLRRQVNEELQATIQEYDQKNARPRSLEEILEASSLPQREVNAFLKEEYLIRCAQRICMFQERIGYPHIGRVPELSHAYNLHLDCFELMQRYNNDNNNICATTTTTTTKKGEDSDSDEDSDDDNDFTPIVQSIVEKGRHMVPLLCKGMSNLVQLEQQQQLGQKGKGKDTDIFTESFVNQFLNEILLNRIGSNVLMSQYLSLSSVMRKKGKNGGNGGIVDPQCNVTAICGTVARQVRELTFQETGYKPTIRIESHSSIENEDPKQKLTASFPFIPGILTYILQELMKNSAVATAKQQQQQQASSLGNNNNNANAGRSSSSSNAISVVICADESRVMIHIGDKGGGIPFDVGQHIWSYLYTTKQQHQQQGGGGGGSNRNQRAGAAASNLGGFGVGLPLSRLYASYLGGSINLVSLPGYGTHAYVYLPRLPQHLVEVVPKRGANVHANNTNGSSSRNNNGRHDGKFRWDTSNNTPRGEFIL